MLYGRRKVCRFCGCFRGLFEVCPGACVLGVDCHKRAAAFCARDADIKDIICKQYFGNSSHEAGKVNHEPKLEIGVFAPRRVGPVEGVFRVGGVGCSPPCFRKGRDV